MPCRGTGRVISNLGGTASKVTCPWCEGDGVRRPEVDAQARWSHTEGTDQPEAGLSAQAAEEAA